MILDTWIYWFTTNILQFSNSKTRFLTKIEIWRVVSNVQWGHGSLVSWEFLRFGKFWNKIKPESPHVCEYLPKINFWWNALFFSIKFFDTSWGLCYGGSSLHHLFLGGSFISVCESDASSDRIRTDVYYRLAIIYWRRQIHNRFIRRRQTRAIII